MGATLVMSATSYTKNCSGAVLQRGGCSLWSAALAAACWWQQLPCRLFAEHCLLKSRVSQLAALRYGAGRGLGRRQRAHAAQAVPAGHDHRL
jgi:hypothetical protein